MKTFAYRGYDLAGQAARGMVEAMDAKEARELLSARGILPETVHPTSGAQARAGWWQRRAITDEARVSVYRELASLVRAGLPLAQAIEMAMEAREEPLVTVELARIRDALRDGTDVATAFAQTRIARSPIEKSALMVAERSGNLAGAFDQLADHLDLRNRVRERVTSALVYPLFIVVLALLVGAGMFGFVLPAVGKLVMEAHMDIPWITRVLLAAGRMVTTFGLPVLVCLGLGGWLVARRHQASPEFQLQVDRWLYQLPFAVRMRLMLVRHRFAATMALLMRSGVGAVEALELAASSTGSRWIELMMKQQASDVRHGKTLANAVRSIPPLSQGLPAWVAAGEAGGSLPDLLEKAAVRFHEQWSNRVTRALSLIEPILIILVGVFVLLIALAILLPVLQLNRSLM